MGWRCGRLGASLYLGISIIGSAATVMPGRAVAQADTFRTPLRIVAQPLEQALADVARQTGVNILFAPGIVAGLRAPGVNGTMSAREAVSRLIAGTDLILSGDGGGGLILRRSATAANWSTQPNDSVVSNGNLSVAIEGPAIIVTAQKREERSIRIPLSVSVVSHDGLERRQATNFQDLLPLVPGLNVQTNQPGKGRLILRGVNGGGAGATVGVYVDETPFGSSSGQGGGAVFSGDFDTFDVARVEVLRGPQGTLYGASALGGVIKYVTNPPIFNKVEARAQAGVETTKGGEIGYSGTAVVNLPVSGNVAVRASGFYRKYGGFIDSIGTAGSTIADNINTFQSYGGRISALFKPSAGISLRLSAIVQNLDGDATNAVEVDAETLGLLYGRFSRSQFAPTFSNIGYRLYNGTANWSLGFASLVSSTSYSRFRLDQRNDLTIQFRDQITRILGDPVTRPLDMFNLFTENNHKITQELRLSSEKNVQFEWMVGAFYTHERNRETSRYTPFDLLTGRTATDLPLFVVQRTDSTYREYAGFANTTLHVTDRFELSLGGRYSRNEQGIRERQDSFLFEGGITSPVSRSAENVFTYSVAPRFELGDNAAAYARIAKGYRPGGPNAHSPLTSPSVPRSYASDTLVSYEIGFKAELLNHRFSIDASAFYLKWKDIQVLAFADDTAFHQNGKTAVSRGFELTGAIRPAKGLSVSINGAYTDARLTADAPPSVGGLDGDRLPYAPQWAVSANGDYRWAVSDAVTAFVGGSLRLVSKQPADFDPIYRAVHGGQRMLPSYAAINLNAGVELGNWSLELYVKNLGNAFALTTVTTANQAVDVPNGAVRAGILRPRTTGIRMSTKF